MTVAANIPGKNSIGLVSVSSMRGLYHNAPGEGQGSSIGYRLYSTFNIWSPKACVGYAYNGHTAMIARVFGQVSAVVGWNPSSYMAAQVKTVVASVMGSKNRFTCDGLWYDDEAMIQDPTAISLELPVLPIQAANFGAEIKRLVGGTGLGGAKTEYTFMPAEMESNDHPFVGQCTEMAVIILCTWLYQLKDTPGATELRTALFDMANSQNMQERNLMQGKMMQFISNWNQGH
ncbi:MAG TPA: hypothetical protein VMB34_15180 [Acetobacteraceae bacterium]|nr:hypothetical protein [Acetobacteraceae bacterium]